MNPVETCQSTAAETRLQKEKIIPSTISRKSPDTGDLLEKINGETKKQIKIFHVGNRLFPEKKFSVEIPTLWEVRDQNSGAEMRPLKDIFRDFRTGVIHFGGPAGSGKTTLLKETCRRVYEKEFESLLDVEVVLFLRCADINTEKEARPVNLLLSHLEPEPNNDEMQLFHTILSTAPEKVLFLLDGLDTLPEYFLFKSTSQKADGELQNYKIITDLLNGQLYPRCRIITSARDMNLQHLKASPRSHVLLAGLQDESIFNISRQYLDFTDVNTMMTMLQGQHELMSLCRTPMFLISILIARKKDNQFRNISSITDSLLNLMNGFIEGQESLMDVTDKVKLKRLAFNLLERNRFDFSKKTLDDSGLNPKKIESLIFYSPNGRNRVVFFVHQFIHEALAALHLVGLKETRFKENLKKCMDLGSFPIAILMVCRILCSNDTQNFAKKNDLLQLGDGLINKRDILLRLLRNRLINFRNRNNGGLELWTLLALHECGEFAIPIINESLNHVRLCLSPFEQLSISHLFAVMSVATKSEKLTTLALQQCGLSSFHFKIDNLNFCKNNLNTEAMGLVGDIARSCNARELNVSGCSGLLSDSPDNALFSLKKTLEKHKLEVLDVSYNMQCLHERKMTEDTKKKTTHVSYQLLYYPGCPMPDTITVNYTVDGKWNEASYDFVRSVLKLTENVTKRIVLRCWKFSEERQDMMRNCPNACPGLELLLYENDVLVPKPVGGGVLKSESSQNTPTSDLKHQYIACQSRFKTPEKLSKTWTDQIEGSNAPDDSVSERIEKIDGDDSFVLGEERTPNQPILQDFGVCHRTMTEVDVKNIVNDLSKKFYIYELKFRQCDLNEDLVKMLLNKVRGLESPVEIKKLSVTAHDGIEKLLPIICELMKECGTTELNLEESSGSDDFLKVLSQHIEQHKVKLQKLNVSYRENMNFEQLGTIISNGLTDLSLVNCYLQSHDFAAMQVKNSKLQYLDISYNEIDEECMEALPGLLCKDKPVTLVMKGCDLTADEISVFESWGNIEIESLDLSYNTDLEPEGLEEVGRFVRKHNTKTVRLSACEVDGDSLISFKKGLENHELRSLDLSRNPCISSSHKMITEILHDSRVEEFNLSNCKMLSMNIRNLREAMGKQCTTVKAIDLSDSDRRRIDQEYVDSIQNFKRYHTECQLELTLPHLDSGDEQALGMTIKKTPFTSSRSTIICN